VALTLRAARSTSLGALVAAALVAWALTYALGSDMSAEPGTMGIGLLGFLALWALMMTAMMLPSLAPVTDAYLRTIARDPRPRVRAMRATALVAGYLLAWTAYGVVAYVLADIGGMLAADHPDVAPWVAAGALVVAGTYQLTPLKDVCLRHCRSPMGFLLHFSGMRGRWKDLRVGFLHGGVCVGCCWGLMLVLITMGVMNLVWMVAIAAVVILEKTWRHGRRLGLAVGVGLIALGVVVPAYPQIAPGLHQSEPMGAMDM